MRAQSLRWRLGLIGAVAILVALALSVLGLTYLFDRHVQRVAVADLEARALSVVAMIDPGGANGPIFRATQGDPLYDQPFSGHYWQIALGDEVRRSRSLWDFAFPAVTTLPPGTTRVLDLTGPKDEPLLALEQWLAVGGGPDPVALRVIVATDRRALETARRGFLSGILPFLGLLVVLLVGASWAQITVGLRPLTEVSGRVAALRSGRRPRIGDDLPREVLPLAGEIDQLLDARDKELVRARHRAADLAHGLKTPLQALLGDAAQVRELGEPEIADSIEAITATMQRSVDRELARARIQSGRATAQADPQPVVARVVEVLRRTPAGAAILWRIDIPSGLSIRIDPDDLAEAIGALVENAVRHAESTVSIRAVASAKWIDLIIGDDGPGVPASALARLTQRGTRLDEAGDGQGIGLAIVAYIAEAAGGDLLLRNGTTGLEATLRLERQAEDAPPRSTAWRG